MSGDASRTEPEGSKGDSKEPHFGMRLGAYRLASAIAKGGMSSVWVATTDANEVVALKTMLPEVARDPDSRRMFLDEARIAARIVHRNVCRIIELGTQDDTLYIAMELVDGDTLQNLHRPRPHGPLDYGVAARIVADACSGLHAAHELRDEQGQILNVVHRDVSPHNILVDVHGNVKVADFGIVKAVGQMHETTTSGVVRGKLSYMAPEQLAGRADRRSDVFALGCVLYESTTGKRPFGGGADLEVMYAIVSGVVQPPGRHRPHYPAELERIVFRALAPNPDDRFATAAAMWEALEQWIAANGGATSNDVANAMRVRLGDVIDARNQTIHGAIDSLAATARTRVSVVDAKVNRAKWPIAIAVAMVTFGAVIAAALTLRSSSQAAPNVLAQGAQIDASAPSSTQEPIAQDPTPTATASAPSDDNDAIALDVSPNDARILVNGIDLAPGQRALARPAVGAQNRITIEARGYASQTFAIDHETARSIAIKLAPISKRRAPTKVQSSAPTNPQSAPNPFRQGGSSAPVLSGPNPYAASH